MKTGTTRKVKLGTTSGYRVTLQREADSSIEGSTTNGTFSKGLRKHLALKLSTSPTKVKLTSKLGTGGRIGTKTGIVRVVRSSASFFDKLDVLTEQYFASQFFDDLDHETREIERERLRLERYWARRRANGDKAYRVLLRWRKVEAIDLFKMTQHIEPNFFGEKTLQFDEVKRLYEKKARIVWFLAGLYRYLMFDDEGHGWSSKRGFHYSRHRKYYAKLREGLSEKVRQAKWDAKRARVRRRRELREGIDPEKAKLYGLRRGLGNTVPMPKAVLDYDVLNNPITLDELPITIPKGTNWDD